jgi:hypothetical protein
MVRFFIVAVESLLRDLHSQPSGDRLGSFDSIPGIQITLLEVSAVNQRASDAG